MKQRLVVERRRSMALQKAMETSYSTEKENEGHPTFSFRYLNMEVSIKKSDNILFRKIINRMKTLSEMTWKAINTSDRHRYGWELLNKESLKPKKQIPQPVSDVGKFHVFRYDSENHPFVCVVRGTVIYPIFIEARFGDIYEHQ